MKRKFLSTLIVFLAFQGIGNASEEPYDIEPYRGKNYAELYILLNECLCEPFHNPNYCGIYPDEYNLTPIGYIPKEEGPKIDFGQHQHTDGGDYVRECCSTPEIDEYWKKASNLHQMFAQWELKCLNHAYSMSRFKMFEIAKDLERESSYRPNPIQAMFYYWKQVAWVHPQDADALAYALEHGLPGYIDARPEWAPYWKKRANDLRESTKWYIPSDNLQILIKFADISLTKFYQLVDQKGQ